MDVTIPAKTQPGAKLRLAGEGLPSNNNFGDQYILLKPYIPDTIDSAITDSILRTKNK
jgi:DnaJ-class molecular chaperone